MTTSAGGKVFEEAKFIGSGLQCAFFRRGMASSSRGYAKERGGGGMAIGRKVSRIGSKSWGKKGG